MYKISFTYVTGIIYALLNVVSVINIKQQIPAIN